jgi:uncharacterized protein (TIGR02594 family)
MEILDIQKALERHGFNPGPVDGIWGRRTIAAVKAFQTANGLTPDGIVGQLTLRALFGGPATSPASPAPVMTGPLVWYEQALSLVGTKEDRTVKSNPEILKWAKDLNIDYNSDDIPWCGLFVAHCVGAALPDEQLPKHPLRARSWSSFGEQCDPKQGAVLVFWRGSKDAATGHVGFYHSEDGAAFHVLGGNQSDSVNVARIGKNRLLSSRWPRTATNLNGRIVISEAKGKLSHNEA